MITLITGAPGSGKSLILVDEFLREAKEAGRPIVADGIPDLVIDHQPAETVDKWTKTVEDQSSQDGKKLLFSFEQGSLVVIDECQRIFRPRKAGSAVPPEVAAFETHRHQGLDFILITQHPGLLDSNVRRLVGRHLHIRDLGFLGRYVYEWPEATEPDRYKSAPVKRKWKLPKRSFDLYKSSSLHVKPKRGFPTALKVLMVSAVLMAGGIYYAYDSIGKKINPDGVSHAKQIDAAKSGAGAAAALMNADYNPVEVTIPRHPDYPESAPMFDGLRQVKAVPKIVGCLQVGNRCDCYSQQTTRVDVTKEFCQKYVENRPFNPYIEDKPIVETAPEKPEPKQQAQQPPAVQHQTVQPPAIQPASV